MLDNRQIAARLREASQLLEAQGANPFRVSAYRKAADTVDGLQRSVREIFEQGGIAALDTLPNIGAGIASAIAEMLITGRWSQLERLQGAHDPSALFQTVPGIGEETARRIHEMLHIDTLEALELAARDGRLESIPGIGPRRAAAIRAALTELLNRTRLARRRTGGTLTAEPPMGVLLDVDAEYRNKAESGVLPTIAPKRFNPTGESWLPVLHTTRGPWHFTALYSNTARAHELGRTRDWVVLYFYDDEHSERQHTVVTETRGPLDGKRVVRGREQECRDYYAGVA